MFYSLVEMKTNLLLTSDSERKREGAEMGGGGKRAGGKGSHVPVDACLPGCHHCFSLKHNIPCVAYNLCCNRFNCGN